MFVYHPLNQGSAKLYGFWLPLQIDHIFTPCLLLGCIFSQICQGNITLCRFSNNGIASTVCCYQPLVFLVASCSTPFNLRLNLFVFRLIEILHNLGVLLFFKEELTRILETKKEKKMLDHFASSFTWR